MLLAHGISGASPPHWARTPRSRIADHALVAYIPVTTRSLILASASPRRRQLLAQLGVTFQVCPVDVDESPLPEESPLDTQRRITREKARAARMRLQHGQQQLADGAATTNGEQVIIACDTTVLLDGEMLNKPTHADEARAMLRRLRGRRHIVQSVIVLCRDEREVVDIVSSDVAMRPYSDAEIEAYIATGDPFDKAGSYAAQHPTFQPIAEIRGCPLNVVGLALCHLRIHLPELPRPDQVCCAYAGKPCPARLDDPAHVVTRLTSAE